MRFILIIKALLFIILIFGCSSESTENPLDGSKIDFSFEAGNFKEIPEDSLELKMTKEVFASFNHAFFYGYDLAPDYNYTSKVKFSSFYEDARAFFYLSNLEGKVAQVFVEMLVEEERGISLHDPEIEKAITLTNRSFYKAAFSFQNDKINYEYTTIEKPNAKDKKSTKISKIVANHYKSASPNTLKILKKKKGNFPKSQWVDYQKNQLNASHLDASKYTFSSDTLFSEGNNYWLFNRNNMVSTQVSLNKFTNEMDQNGNLIRTLEERDLSKDNYSSNKYIDWITEYSYNSVGLLSKTTRSQEKNKDGNVVFYDQNIMSYKFYQSDKNYFKVEIYASGNKSKAKLISTAIFDEKGNWISVVKKTSSLHRKLVYASEEQ